MARRAGSPACGYDGCDQGPSHMDFLTVQPMQITLPIPNKMGTKADYNTG